MENQISKKDFKPIIVKDLFMDKNPRLARIIPGFVYRIIHKIMVLDFINEILRDHGNEKGFEFTHSVINKFNVTVDVKGMENLPADKRCIFVSNHPLGGFDGGLIFRQIGEHYNRNFRVLVNDLLMNVKNMEGFFIPINKHGAQGSDNVRRIDDLYRTNDQIMIFPAGLVSRRKKGKIEDPPWHKHFVTKAKAHKRDVVTIHITGRCSNLFFNVSNIRKFLRIKSNLEMFLLPRETFKHVNQHFTITIGKPISYEVFDKRHKPIDWAEKVKQYCYELAEDSNATFKAEN